MADMFDYLKWRGDLTFSQDPPNEVDALYVTEGEDYCTLVTCTPYGINTHRMLVRGTRVETPEVKNIYITTDAYRIDSLILTPIVAAPMLLVLLIILLVRHPKKKEDNTASE